MPKKGVESKIDTAGECVAAAAIGAKAGCRGYQLRVNSSGNCKVNVLTKAKGSARPNWVVRFDQAHGGVNPAGHVPHINVNPQVNTKLRVDPHWKIPAGTKGLKVLYIYFSLPLRQFKIIELIYNYLKVAENVAKGCKVANKVLLPVAIAVDVVDGGKAIYHDIDRGTSRNTVETGAAIAGGWGGGYGGATCGAAIGSLIFPGIGTIIGGIVGGIGGGIGGSLISGKVAECIGDDCGYDIELAREPCRRCKRYYRYRKYLRKDNGYCDDCNNN